MAVEKELVVELPMTMSWTSSHHCRGYKFDLRHFEAKELRALNAHWEENLELFPSEPDGLGIDRTLLFNVGADRRHYSPSNVSHYSKIEVMMKTEPEKTLWKDMFLFLKRRVETVRNLQKSYSAPRLEAVSV